MALRRFLSLLRAHGLARARRAAAAAAARGQQARACADGRVRAIRARCEVATSAAVACAEARARAATAFFLHAERQAGTAAAFAAQRLRQDYDQVVSTFLRVAYGECAPKTPSPHELLRKLTQLALRIRDIQHFVLNVDMALEFFNTVSPYEAYFILSVLLAPLAAFHMETISTAPEAVCPFLGVRALEFDVCPVDEGLRAVFALSARCGATVILVVGGLLVSACIDIGSLVVGSFHEDPSASDGVPDYAFALSYVDGQPMLVVHKLSSWGYELR